MQDKENDARRERLRRARHAAGYRTATHFAEANATRGIAVSTYKSHENGSRSVSQNAAMHYAQTLGIPFEWLWNGRGDMGQPVVVKAPVSNVATATNILLPSVRKLPVFGRARAGAEGVLVLDGTVTDSVPCPPNLGEIENAYAIEVVGECMRPRYEPGEIVYVHPTKAVHAGSYVIIQVQDGSELIGMVKRFVRASDSYIVVEQLNPPRELEFARASIVALHRIVGSGMK